MSSCETEFIKTCVKKTEKVCMDVTEMKCEVRSKNKWDEVSTIQLLFLGEGISCLQPPNDYKATNEGPYFP